MASFTERIRLVFDVDNKGALSGFAGFRKSIADADGVTGKFKAGLGSLKAGFGQFMTSGAGMATVATGVAAGLVKAVTASQDLALSVGHLAEATGLSTEAASRWLETADDVGVSSDQLATLIVRMTKSLGSAPEDFAKFGIEIRHAADGTVDMNATLLGAIGVLHDIKDPTQRATLASKLFGKAWADSAELISMSAADLKGRLDGVTDSKIMSPEQIKQAREFRDAMDDLADLGEDFMLTVGKELVPVLTDLANVLADVGAVAGTVDGALGDVSGDAIGLKDVFYTVLTGGVYPLWKGLESLRKELKDGREWTEGMAVTTERLAGLMKDMPAILDTANAATATFAQGTEEAGHALHDQGMAAEEAEEKLHRETVQADLATRAHRTLAEKVDEVTRKWSAFTEELSDEDAMSNAVLAVSGLAEELAAIEADDELTAAEKLAKVGLATNDMKGQVAGALTQWGFLSAALRDKLIAQVEAGDIDGFIRKMQILEGIALRMKAMGVDWFGTNVGRSSTTGGGAPKAYASGTSSAARGLALVGEEGPELVNLRGGESILPAGATAAALGGGAGATYNITVNTLKADADIGRVVVDAINAHTRNGGQGPR